MKTTLVPRDDLLVPLDNLLVPAPRTAEPQPTTVRGWLDRFRTMSAQGIASFMRQEGVLGTPGNGNDCGFAVFFKRYTNEHVTVCGCHVEVGPRIMYELPQSCREFVSAFDAGRFPYLYRHPQVRRWMPSVLVAAPWSQVVDFSIVDMSAATFLSLKARAELLAGVS